jgi:hypothetical protein
MKLPWRKRSRDEAKSERPAVVLGTQLAAARSTEADVRAAHPDLRSPLSAAYDFWAGEMDLARFVPSPVDDLLRAVVHDFLDASDDERSLMRTALRMDDLYTVLDFSRRGAVAALRERSLSNARDSLHALALIDIERIDWRDLPGPLELAAYAISDTGGDPANELQRLRDMSRPEVGEMTRRLERPEEAPSLGSAGWAPVQTTHGFGLIECWGGGEDSVRLGPLLVAFADVVDRDDYRTASLTLSDGLPAVWFPKPARERAEELVDEAAAAGSLSANRRPGPTSDSQQFTLFIADVGSSAAAHELLTLASDGERSDFASLALAQGSMFALLIARSFVDGTESVETDESLRRFADPFRQVLRGS